MKTFDDYNGWHAGYGIKVDVGMFMANACHFGLGAYCFANRGGRL